MTTLIHIEFPDLVPSPIKVKSVLESQTGLIFDLLKITNESDKENSQELIATSSEVYLLRNSNVSYDLFFSHTKENTIIIDLIYMGKKPCFAAKLYITMMELGGKSEKYKMPKYSNFTYDIAKKMRGFKP